MNEKLEPFSCCSLYDKCIKIGFCISEENPHISKEFAGKYKKLCGFNRRLIKSKKEKNQIGEQLKLSLF